MLHQLKLGGQLCTWQQLAAVDPISQRIVDLPRTWLLAIDTSKIGQHRYFPRPLPRFRLVNWIKLSMQLADMQYLKRSK
jgi:hypothetical protein